MPRALPEWIGKTPNAAIPPRVAERVSRRCNDACKHCGFSIGPKLKGAMDHIVPLILGGGHRESNLQLLCVPCHATKTGLDLKLKAKVARIRKRDLGFTAPRKQIKSRGFAKSAPQRSATRPLERRT